MKIDGCGSSSSQRAYEQIRARRAPMACRFRVDLRAAYGGWRRAGAVGGDAVGVGELAAGFRSVRGAVFATLASKVRSSASTWCSRSGQPPPTLASWICSSSTSSPPPTHLLHPPALWLTISLFFFLSAFPSFSSCCSLASWARVEWRVGEGGLGVRHE